MAYGDEVDHLEASGADVTLGDLQSVPVASDGFQQRLRQCLDIGATRRTTPCFTVITGDKDDPRFDSYYLAGNELRYFCALFLPNMPSYAALGFELRDRHPEPFANEFYSKLYVFQVRSGTHATQGRYRFGGNARLFLRLQRIKQLSERLRPRDAGTPVWLLPPDATGGRKVIAWAMPARTEGGNVVRSFVANCDTVAPAMGVKVPLLPVLAAAAGGDALAARSTECIFESVDRRSEPPRTVTGAYHLPRIGRGECRVYETVLGNGPG
jgi:hypothetical protein